MINKVTVQKNFAGAINKRNGQARTQVLEVAN